MPLSKGGAPRRPWPGSGAATLDFAVDQAPALLASALSAGAVAAWHTDLRTRERWWSQEMVRLHGLSHPAQAPADYLALVHPQDRPLVEDTFRASVEAGAHAIQYRVVWPDGSAHWIEGTGRTTCDADGQPLSISGVCTLIDARKREEADLRFLAQASAELARSTDYSETLRRVAAMAVPHFADWCAVDMLDDRHQLQRLEVAHVDASKRVLAARLHERYPPQPDAAMGAWKTVHTRQPEMLSEIPEALLLRTARDEEHAAILRSLGLRSYMSVPMVGADRVLGVITFVASESGRVYGPRDLELASDLVSRAAIAVQNAELFRSLHRSQARQAFLLALTDRLRQGSSLADTLQAISEMLGRQFGVDRVGYGHVDETLDVIDYDACWTRPAVAPLAGRYPASAFGPQVIEQLRSGRTIAIPDVRNHPLTSESRTLETSREVDTRAILVVPLSAAGRLRTIVYLNQALARDWTADEVSLMEEVAERTRERIERARAEEALRTSESRWRGLFEQMSEGFFTAQGVRDGSGRIVDFRFMQVNPAFEALTGIAPADAADRLVTQVIPGVESELIDVYGRVVDTGEPAEFEVRVHALGDRWYEARARRIAPEQFAVLFMEITRRKQVELELALSAARYKTLFESIDEGFCILEVLFDAQQTPIDYRFLEVNPAFERQAGLPNPVGRTIRELIPDIEATYIEIYGQVALTGQPLRFESQARALHRWFDAFAFRIGDPALRRVALLFTDITRQKRASDALAQREYELGESQRVAGIGSWLWVFGTGGIEVSPQLKRIFGLAEDAPMPDIEAQRGTLYHEEDWARLRACLDAAIEHGVPYAIDLRAWRSGQPIWVTARGLPLREDGRVVGLRGTIQDITERKEIEQALREADSRKDEFLATLAHELRNPLAPLRNGLAILRKADVASAASRRAQELMERQLTHLVRLVDDLLDVSRVSHNKVAMKKAPTALGTVIDLALETARPLIDAAGHELVVELPQQPVVLDVDPTRMAQVLSNLLNNAAKYTPAGGHLALSAAVQPPDRLYLRVRDDGVGIPRDMLDKVFDLFTQVGSAFDRAQGGLGIGLSLARRLVELHGGRIHAESGGDRRGSCFVVELPLPSQPGVPQADRVAPQAPHGGPRRILLVDDNVDGSESLALLLREHRHEVRVVHRGLDAVEAATRDVPDVVLLDIGLPDINGHEVAERLRRDPALDDTLLVAVTGWGDARDRERARQAGIDLHLTKPVDDQALLAALATSRNRREPGLAVQAGPV